MRPYFANFQQKTEGFLFWLFVQIRRCLKKVGEGWLDVFTVVAAVVYI